MKRKPDLIMVLVLLFSIAVVVTGYARHWRATDSDFHQHALMA